MVSTSTSLLVRLDPDSKTCVARAAELRHVSMSDYVRSVVVAQARREIQAAEQQVIALTPAEQQEFRQALQEPTALTTARQTLGALMRGNEEYRRLTGTGCSIADLLAMPGAEDIDLAPPSLRDLPDVADLS